MSTTEGNWIDELDDEELADLFEQILAALYVRAHNRSHEEEAA